MEKLIAALRKGEAVLLRTDTVFGIAARPKSLGIQDIYRLKGRPHNQPLPCFVRNQDIEKYADNISEEARKLIRAFWPGALTLILNPNKEAQKEGLLPSYKSIAFRCPGDQFCLDLLAKIRYPLCCTSANIHGEKTPIKQQDINPCFLQLAHGPLETAHINSQASTIVDCTCRSPKILRKGSITSIDIERVIEC